MYVYKFGHPIDTLPNRIRLSDGSTRTGYDFTEEELNEAGWFIVEDKPLFDSNTHKCSWDSTNRSWIIDELNEFDIKARLENQMVFIRNKRQSLFKEYDWRLSRYNSEVRLGLTPTDDIQSLDEFAQALRDLTKIDDPFNVVFPNLIPKSTDKTTIVAPSTN